MMNSTGNGRHSRTVDTFGSGTAIRWFGAMPAVRSNQKAASWLSTCPLNGRVPTTTIEAADPVRHHDRAAVAGDVVVTDLALFADARGPRSGCWRACARTGRGAVGDRCPWASSRVCVGRLVRRRRALRRPPDPSGRARGGAIRARAEGEDTAYPRRARRGHRRVRRARRSRSATAGCVARGDRGRPPPAASREAIAVGHRRLRRARRSRSGPCRLRRAAAEAPPPGAVVPPTAHG
jgi:hypothetical protein